MYIDEENPEKLKQLGLKIKAAKVLRKDIIDFFVKDDKLVYGTTAGETEFLIDIIKMYINGESTDYIGDAMQTGNEDIIRMLGLLGLEI